jgi:nitronate monooxygenase
MAVRDMPSGLHTPLCDLLGIRVPVLLAPMAQGPGTPELAAAVTRAGGLGILPITGMTRETAADAVRRALELGGPPVGVNVQLAPAAPGPGIARELREYLAPVRSELGLPVEPGDRPAADPPVALVEAALGAGATVVGGALGDPRPLAAAARGAGAPLLAMVSTADEARRSVAAGADALIAQGAEAGGHRTAFEVPPDGPPLIGTLALVPRVVDCVDVPVVAAGGIMDGRGLVAALALGAQGALLGTRFLLATEAGIPDAYRMRVLATEETDTIVTDRVTGRPARWLRNRITEMLASGPPSLGWPAQAAEIADIRAEAARTGHADLLPMLAGQGAGLAGDVRPAGEIVEQIVSEARAVLSRLAG